MSKLSSKKQDIITTVTEEAKKEIFTEFDEGLTQANNYISEIKNQTLVEIKKINDDANRQSESEKRKIIGAAEIKSKNNYLQILEDTITQIFDTVLSKFMKHVSKQRYEKLLIRLIEESVDALNTKKINIVTNKHDLAYVKSIIPNINKKKNVNLKLIDPINCVGGIKAYSDDNSTVFNNTIEALLNRWKPILRQDISNIIGK